MEEILVVVLGVALYLLWLLLAATCKFIIRIVSSIWNDLTGETARGKIREENARKEEEERKQRERELQRERRQEESRERKRFRTENSEVFAGIADLLSTCAVPVVEILRAEGAIEGKDFELNPKHVVLVDVESILAAFSKSGSTGDAYIATLWQELTRLIEPSDVKGVPPLSGVPNRGVKQLSMVVFLAKYDKQRGTDFTSKAASTYHSIVSAVYGHCAGSLATKMVADRYIELLSPYIHGSGGNGYAGNSSSSASSQSNRKSVCAECVKGYQLLDLPFGASKDEVKQKRDALAQVLHSYHTGGMSKRTRDTAEEQLKSIIAAYSHIRNCRFSGINGSEPPPAPHQSTSATTAGDKTGHQPSPASSSDERCREAGTQTQGSK
jgi:hypothetical protein